MCIHAYIYAYIQTRMQTAVWCGVCGVGLQCEKHVAGTLRLPLPPSPAWTRLPSCVAPQHSCLPLLAQNFPRKYFPATSGTINRNVSISPFPYSLPGVMLRKFKLFPSGQRRQLAAPSPRHCFIFIYASRPPGSLGHESTKGTSDMLRATTISRRRRPSTRPDSQRPNIK